MDGAVNLELNNRGHGDESVGDLNDSNCPTVKDNSWLKSKVIVTPITWTQKLVQLFCNNNQVKETEPVQGNEMEQPPKGEETDLPEAKELELSTLSTLPVVHHDETSKPTQEDNTILQSVFKPEKLCIGRTELSLDKSETSCNADKQSRPRGLPHKMGHDDRGRGSLITISSQAFYKLNRWFPVLLFGSMLLTGSAAQPVRNGAHHCDNPPHHQYIMNATDLESHKDVSVRIVDEDDWRMTGLLEVQSLCVTMCAFLMALGTVLVVWRVCTYLIGRPPTAGIANAQSVQDHISDTDSNFSDDDSYQSSFEPAYPVAAQHNDFPLPRMKQSTLMQKDRKRHLSHSYGTPQEFESGLTLNRVQHSDGCGEIVFGLPSELSERSYSTDTLESFHHEDAALNPDGPPSTGKQESIEGHHSMSVMVSGRVLIKAVTCTVPAVNVLIAPPPSFSVTTDTVAFMTDSLTTHKPEREYRPTLANSPLIAFTSASGD